MDELGEVGLRFGVVEKVEDVTMSSNNAVKGMEDDDLVKYHGLRNTKKKCKAKIGS